VIGEEVQFAAGQPSRGEAAVHAKIIAFNDDGTEGMLLMLSIPLTELWLCTASSICVLHFLLFLPAPCLPLC